MLAVYEVATPWRRTAIGLARCLRKLAESADGASSTATLQLKSESSEVVRRNDMVSTAPFDRPLTAGDLAEMPDDGIRYELIWGELYMSPAPNTKHLRVLGRLFVLLNGFVLREDSGEVFVAPFDVRFDEFNVVQPDLLVIGSEHSNRVTEAGVVEAPDLCVEILSSGSRSRDFVKKNVLYAKFGVPEYWIVDPERERITVHVLEADQYVPQESLDGVARSQIFPGLEIDPRGLSSSPVPQGKSSKTAD